MSTRGRPRKGTITSSKINLGKDDASVSPSKVRFNLLVTFILLNKKQQEPTIKFKEYPFSEQISEDANGEELSFASTYEGLKEAIIMHKELDSQMNDYDGLYKKNGAYL